MAVSRAIFDSRPGITIAGIATLWAMDQNCPKIISNCFHDFFPDRVKP